MSDTADAGVTRVIWGCKVGGPSGPILPHGADGPMREAVESVNRTLTGEDPEFTFSGWGATLTEPELAVVEDREPSTEYETQWHEATTELRAEIKRLHRVEIIHQGCEHIRLRDFRSVLDQRDDARAEVEMLRAAVLALPDSAPIGPSNYVDEGYDEVDALIDEDPIELGRRYRTLRSAVAALHAQVSSG